MRQMIRYELEKICGRRVVWISFLLLFLFTAVASVSSLYGSNKVADTEGNILTGKEGKAYIKEHTEKYAGLLNDEKVQEILKEEAPGKNGDEYLSYYAHPLYEGVEALFRSNYAPYKEMTMEALTKEGITVEVGNAERWTVLLVNLQWLFQLMGVMLIVALAGIFPEEYTRGTDALILTSRHGKKKSVYAKVTAAFLFTLGACGGIFAATYLPFFLEDGLYGWDAGIQLSGTYGLEGMPFTMNCLEATLIYGGICLVSMLTVTGFVLIISVLCKTAFSSVVIGAAVYIAPIMASNFLPMEVTCSTPMGAVVVEGMASLPAIELFGIPLMFHIRLLPVVLILGLAAWIVAKKAFASHQVA